MMTEGIIISIITGIITVIGTLLSNLVIHSKTIYRIEQLEKKQDKHNNLIERMYCCENSINLLDERIKDTQEDVTEIKRKIDNGKLGNGNIA